MEGQIALLPKSLPFCPNRPAGKMQNATDQEARCIRILQTNQEYPLRRKFACTSPVPAEAGKLIIHETNQSMQINQTDPCCTFAEWRQLRK